MKKLVSLLFLLLTITPAFGLSCYTQSSVIIWVAPDRIIQIVDASKLPLNDPTVTALMMNDIYSGDATILNKNTPIEIMEVTPIVTKVRVGNFFGYTVTGTLLCR